MSFFCWQNSLPFRQLQAMNWQSDGIIGVIWHPDRISGQKKGEGIILRPDGLSISSPARTGL